MLESLYLSRRRCVLFGSARKAWFWVPNLLNPVHTALKCERTKDMRCLEFSDEVVRDRFMEDMIVTLHDFTV
jgi:hypothetical protein